MSIDENNYQEVMDILHNLPPAKIDRIYIGSGEDFDAELLELCEA